jgi:uncharacterized protein (DUF4415 family)
MKKNEEYITTVKIDLDNLPPLTPEQQAGLDALAARPDSEIDYSDIPPLTDEELKQFYRPVKAMTTVRIDADILHWLRSQGKGYQTRINAILRKEMLASRRRSENVA